jgi:hypothetical protein
VFGHLQNRPYTALQEESSPASVTDWHWLFWSASVSASQHVWSSVQVCCVEPLEPLELDALAHAGSWQPDFSVQAWTFCAHAMQPLSGCGHFWRHAVSPQSHASTHVMYVPHAPPNEPFLKPEP